MKNLFLILSIICAMQCFAQDPQLLDTTWYLDYIFMNSEELHPPGEEGEATVIPMDISLVDFNTVVCDSHACNDIDFNGGNDSFTLISCVTGIFGCEFNENEAYQNLYFYDFFNADFPPNSFDYTIEVNGNKKTLTLTNATGIQAIYSDQILAIIDETIVDVRLYPNPVSDLLTISSPNNEILSIHIYDLLGKQITSFKSSRLENIEISLTNLDSGIYFLKILTDAGQVIKKIIKE